MSIEVSLNRRTPIQATLNSGDPLQVEMMHSKSAGGSASSVRVVDVNLYASAWVGSQSPYYQVVEVEGATRYSKVDLQPSVEQLDIFHDKDIAFSTENEEGVVTVFVVGDKPSIDYVIQATVTEVVL